ncbi:MAG: NADH/ubiquinone/plastoquinone (complex I) [Candidatus Eisenbacteria bacterium]|nr:NADH/ubiquinone/plastoquinone (complex I) [Candidatus Eisenbacteria bacterium]
MNLLPYYVAIPLGLAFLIPLLSKWWKRSGEVLAVGGTAILAAMALGAIGSPTVCYHMGGWRPPVGIALMSDGLTVLLLIAVNVVGFLCVLFSLRYMRSYTALEKYYALFMLMITGMNGVVITADVFNLFVFLEIASIASYALVPFGIEADELEAGFKYLILGSVASTMVLFAIGTVYAVTGSLNIADVAREIATKHATGDLNPALLLSAAFFLMGFGLKAALVPFHAWLPDAHPSAPAPVSAMLSGVVIKSLGVYAMCRVFFHMFGFSPAVPSSVIIANSMIAFAIASIVFGGLLAVGQWDYKRLLAYSSIGQVGYVVLGIGVGARVLATGGQPAVAALAILGGLFHLINHTAFKALLFLSSGAIQHATGTRDMKQLGGLRLRMPVTSTTTTLAALSIAGIPPFSGFWSKLVIIIATIKAGHPAIASVAVAMAFVTLAYYVKVQREIIFGAVRGAVEKAREVPALMCIPLVVLAIVCVGFGLLYPAVGSRILEPARDALLDGAAYVRAVLG